MQIIQHLVSTQNRPQLNESSHVPQSSLMLHLFPESKEGVSSSSFSSDIRLRPAQGGLSGDVFTNC